jgi:hypothetical protein
MKVHIRILEEGFQDISLTHEINSSLQWNRHSHFSLLTLEKLCTNYLSEW